MLTWCERTAQARSKSPARMAAVNAAQVAGEKDQLRPGRVLGVAYCDDAGQVGCDFDTVAVAAGQVTWKMKSARENTSPTSKPLARKRNAFPM